MKFAFRVAKHVKSNAVVYAKDGQTAGIGAGQMSRIDSARIAAIKAEEAAKAAGWAEPMTKGSAVASEAFLPFPDSLLPWSRPAQRRSSSRVARSRMRTSLQRR